VTSSAACPQPSALDRVSFACLNVRSLNDKLEGVLELCETAELTFSLSPSHVTGATENARPENAGLENDGQLRKESQGLENDGPC